MKDKKFHKFSVRAVVALLCATLVSSCAYESYSPGNYPTSRNRGTGNPAVPVLIGAAAVGALVLASRSSKRHKSHYNRGSHHGSNYGSRHSSNYGTHRPYYSSNRGHRTHNSHVNHSNYRNHRNHRNHRSHNRGDRGNNNNNENTGRGNRGDRGSERGARDRGNNLVVKNRPVLTILPTETQSRAPRIVTGLVSERP